jgi:2Fe-2S ferredoxin
MITSWPKFTFIGLIELGNFGVFSPSIILAQYRASSLTRDKSMGKVTFIQHSGEESTVEVENGVSLMRAALDNLVPGIDADCGGECSCATCHILVAEDWVGKAGQPGDQENSMLDLNPDREATSRLACQIPMSEDLDGIVVNLPEFQY